MLIATRSVRLAAVGQDDQGETLVDRLLRLVADAVQRALQPAGLLGTREGDVDRLGPPAAVVHALERRQFLVGQDRMRDQQSTRNWPGVVSSRFASGPM